MFGSVKVSSASVYDYSGECIAFLRSGLSPAQLQDFVSSLNGYVMFEIEFSNKETFVMNVIYHYVIGCGLVHGCIDDVDENLVNKCDKIFEKTVLCNTWGYVRDFDYITWAVPAWKH